jgi:hypothetical protein
MARVSPLDVGVAKQQLFTVTAINCLAFHEINEIHLAKDRSRHSDVRNCVLVDRPAAGPLFSDPFD